MLIAAAGGSSLNGGDDGDELVGGPGGDSLVGGAGDDSISSRDALSEQVSCGAGADTAVADNLDGLAGCEQIDRGDQSAKDGDAADPEADVVAPALSKLSLGRRAVRFSLSEGATVTLRLVRAKAGRWVRTRRSLTFGATAGRNRVALRGRLARRMLAAGRYRLVARATDAAGNRSAPRRAAFRVIRR